MISPADRRPDPPSGGAARPRLRLFRQRRGHAPLRGAARDFLFRERHLPQSSRYILPNLFTALSLFLALCAIVRVADGEYVVACWMILGSAVCDAIDGPVARWTRSSSEFGLQFDSLADVVAFGIVPAFLMYSNLAAMDESLLPNYAPKLALGACSLYAICAAIRLARFNVQATTVEKRHFTGLPTPGAAGAVVTAFLTVHWLMNIPAVQAINNQEWLTRNLHRAILALMVGLALVMVSEIPFPKLRNLISFRAKPINALVLLVVIFCLMITLQNYLSLLLFGAFVAYIGGSIVVAARRGWLLHGIPVQEPPTPTGA